MFLSRFGKLKTFFLVSGRGKQNRHKGYGFVEFADLKDTKKALLESGKHKLDSKRIKFNFTRGGSSTDIRTKMSCWFCLDNPESDKSLVVHETPEVYLALDKGPIDKFHFLMVPQSHKKNNLHLSESETSAMKKLDSQLQEFFLSEKKAFIRYEQSLRLSSSISHMLVHYISLPADKFETLEVLFLLNAKETKLEFFDLQPSESVSTFVRQSDDKHFISLTFSNPVTLATKRRVCIVSDGLAGKLPADFMRQFVCRILDRPDRANWKDCVRPAEEVTFLQQRLKKFFSEHSSRGETQTGGSGEEGMEQIL